MSFNPARAARAHGRAAEPHSAVPGATDFTNCPRSIALGGNRRRRHGSLLALVPVVAVLLAMMTVLAVDWGRIQVVRGELQAAVDAAALHAVTGVQSGSYESRATASLVDNHAGGQPIMAQPGDVVMGQWDDAADKMIPNQQPADCISITARTTVDLFFGGFVGVPQVDLKATAIAGLGESIWGLTGIDSVELRGVTIDSYQPSVGPYALTKRNKAVVSSNGEIRLDGSSIAGDAYAGMGFAVNGGSVSGKRKRQAHVRAFEPVTSAEWSGGYDNSPLAGHLTADGSFELAGNTHLQIPAGTYVVNNLKLTGTSTLEALGPVTLYVNGEVDMAGTMSTWASNPDNLSIRVTSNKDVRLMGTADFYGDVYAPLSHIRIGGNPGLFGKVVGKRLEVWGNVSLHHDERLDRFPGRGNFLRQ